ncbi:hypothetical protein GCM10020331_014450 [Ectobacillus funiculus]
MSYKLKNFFKNPLKKQVSSRIDIGGITSSDKRCRTINISVLLIIIIGLSFGVYKTFIIAMDEYRRKKQLGFRELNK